MRLERNCEITETNFKPLLTKHMDFSRRGSRPKENGSVMDSSDALAHVFLRQDLDDSCKSLKTKVERCAMTALMKSKKDDSTKEEMMKEGGKRRW